MISTTKPNVQATAINETGEEAALRTTETPSHTSILCHIACGRAAVFVAITVSGAAQNSKLPKEQSCQNGCLYYRFCVEHILQAHAFVILSAVSVQDCA